MTTLTPEQIKEAAEQLDCGFRCFWNTKTNDFIFIPDLMKYPDMEMSSWEEEMDMLKYSRADFKEIPSLESSDSFEIMEQFTDQLPDTLKLKDELINALNRKHPFRNFKFVIDDSGDYRQNWFDFKNQWLQDWVKENFESTNE